VVKTGHPDTLPPAEMWVMVRGGAPARTRLCRETAVAPETAG